MACEDSTSFDCCFDGRSRHSSYPRVHRIRNVHDLEKTTRREVLAAPYAIQHVVERLECLSLYDESPVAKRDNPLGEILEVSNGVLQRLIPGSGSRVWRDGAAAQTLLKSA
jgi:hypothetical protein